MDPLTAVGTVLSLTDIALRTTSALVTFVRDTKNASRERTLLAEEATSLSELLKQLHNRAANKKSDKKWLEDSSGTLTQLQRAYNGLAKSLGFDEFTGQPIAESRPKAMRRAAKWSFAKSDVYMLLERVSRLQQCINTLLLDHQLSLLEQLNTKQQEGSVEKQKSKLLTWLTKVDMSEDQSGVSEKGSGMWFLTSGRFRDWEDGRQNLLWCWGIPGAGKTVLAYKKPVANHLLHQHSDSSSDDKIGVAIAYLKYNEPEHTSRNLLACLLKQLIKKQGSVSDSLQALYKQHVEHNTPLSLDEIAENLKTTTETYTKVFFIIDALDECSEKVRWDLVEKLEQFQCSVHIMITSRFLGSIQEDLTNFKQLEIRAHRSDIELFIDSRVSKNKNLRKIVEGNPSMREDIKNKVVETAENMFLLARLHVDALADAAGLTVKNVRNKLETLPTTLEATYDEAMQRIPNSQSDWGKVAHKILAWVSYAFRPLSLEELQHALAVQPEGTDLDEDSIMDASKITALCAGLVTVDPRSNAVNLVHYTTKDYFEKNRSKYFPKFHANITMSCATYLSFNVLRTAGNLKITRDFPLARYAAQHMADHARQNPEEALEPFVLERISQLLSYPATRNWILQVRAYRHAGSIRFGAVRKVAQISHRDAMLESESEDESESSDESMLQFSEDSLVDWSEDSSEDTSEDMAESVQSEAISSETDAEVTRRSTTTALHVAALMGLVKVAAMLLDKTSNIDAVDDGGETALTLAMGIGFEKVVDLLVNRGASVDLRRDSGRLILLHVLERNWNHIADVIVRQAESVVLEEQSSTVRDHVQLLITAYQGDEKTIRRLVDHANVDLRQKDRCLGIDAFFIAIERGHSEILDCLLMAGVEVNSKNHRGQTPLHQATWRQSEVLMRLLLERGATVDLKDDSLRTAFHANVRSSDEYYLKILLDAGADPNTKRDQGISELYDAAAEGDVEHVKILLRSGTNPSIRTNYGWAPLHWAASNGMIEVVKLLVNAGAELSPVSDQHKTPLDMVLGADRGAIADILRSAGAVRAYDIPRNAGAVRTPDEIEEEMDWESDDAFWEER